MPNFHAGKSEKRCQQFAAKYLAKLNLLRTSRWDLGDAYRKQVKAMLQSYCKEWQRICRSKAHGHLGDNANAQTAFRIYFGLLRDDSKCSIYGRFEGVGVL